MNITARHSVVSGWSHIQEGGDHWLDETQPSSLGGDQQDDRINQLFLCGFCPCTSSLSRLVLLLWVLFFSYDLPWVWSQHIVLELPRFCDLMFLLCILIFPFVSFVLFCCFLGEFFFCFSLLVSVCWKGALRTWLKQCVHGKKKCHGEEICLFFSYVAYFFVHYSLPNLVLLTLLVKELEGLVICYKSYL